ncbi:MAG: heavy-metal-associated domain-containing protein [Bacteroidetes bacterium]|nr:heavy-metal-associated domain-containing protein [Bacteroidota bacterium]
MKYKTRIASLCVALLMTAALAPHAQAQNKIENPDVTIAVDGLACPFCAYGLEKKLKKLEGVEALTVDMKEGQVQIKLKEGATVTEEQISEAVTDAGFTVTEITYPEKKKTTAKETDTTGRSR